MKPDLTVEEAKKKISRLERKVSNLKAENLEYRQMVRNQSTRLKQLQQKYLALELNSDELLAEQAAELLEMENYIHKLEARLNSYTNPKL